MKAKKLSAAQGDFVGEYLRNGKNASLAFRYAYNCDGLSNGKVHDRARALLEEPAVELAILKATDRVVTAAEFDAARVLREWVEIATADANELIQHRRLCCRYCHGKQHAYQWKDGDEFARALAEAIHSHEVACATAARLEQKAPEADLPNDAGGYGFRFNAIPHSGCPRCFGEGYPDVFIADTRFVSPAARKLYLGVHKTKDGIKVLMRDQAAALDNIAKYLGMLKDRVPTPAFPGQPGNAPLTLPMEVPNDPLAAATFYRDLMKLPAPTP